MDDADRAKILEVQHREAAIKAALTQPPSEQQCLCDGVIICRDCYKPIPEERLQAKPDAVRCMPCKRIWERKNAS